MLGTFIQNQPDLAIVCKPLGLTYALEFYHQTGGLTVHLFLCQMIAYPISIR
jgi:hypothetical protein